MKLRESRYVPKKRKNVLLRALEPVLCAGVAVLWFFHESLEISSADMFIVTGLVLAAVVIASANRRTERGLEVDEAYLEKLRDNIGKDKYGDNSVFFD